MPISLSSNLMKTVSQMKARPNQHFVDTESVSRSEQAAVQQVFKSPTAKSDIEVDLWK